MNNYKEDFIKINVYTDIIDFVKNCQKVEGDILVKRGVYIVDAKSLMGVMSVDVSDGITVQYPANAIEFENFIQKFKN